MGDLSLCSHHIFERLICMWSRVRQRVVMAPLWAFSPRRSLLACSVLSSDLELSSWLFMASLSRATFPFPCLSGGEQGFNLSNEIFNDVVDCFNVFVKCVWFYSGKAWIEMSVFGMKSHIQGSIPPNIHISSVGFSIAGYWFVQFTKWLHCWYRVFVLLFKQADSSLAIPCIVW